MTIYHKLIIVLSTVTLFFLSQSTLLLFVGVNSSPTSGPFQLVFTSVGNCPAGNNEEEKIVIAMRSNRMSRSKLALNINVSLGYPVDDNLDIAVNLAKQTSQGWKDNFFMLEMKKACTTLKTYVPAMERDLSRQLKIKTCPIPPGNYSNLFIPLDFDLKMMPIIPYGKYRSRVYLLHGHKKVFCVESIVNIVPKKNG